MPRVPPRQGPCGAIGAFQALSEPFQALSSGARVRARVRKAFADTGPQLKPGFFRA